MNKNDIRSQFFDVKYELPAFVQRLKKEYSNNSYVNIIKNIIHSVFEQFDDDTNYNSFNEDI